MDRYLEIIDPRNTYSLIFILFHLVTTLTFIGKASHFCSKKPV